MSQINSENFSFLIILIIILIATFTYAFTYQDRSTIYTDIRGVSEER